MKHSPEEVAEWQGEAMTQDAIKRLMDLRGFAMDELMACAVKSEDARVRAAGEKIAWIDELLEEYASGQFRTE